MLQDDSEKTFSSVKAGGLAFLIRVQFRQNACWQGSIQWLEGKKTMPFRSLLEMVMLIQDALDMSGLKDETAFRSWEEKEVVS